jgi:hypothetical protein
MGVRRQGDARFGEWPAPCPGCPDEDGDENTDGGDSDGQDLKTTRPSCGVSGRFAYLKLPA